MICTIVKRNTFDRVLEGKRTLVFDRKPYWERRLGTRRHRAIILLNARRCRCFLIESVEAEKKKFRVTLGEAFTWPRQMDLLGE